MAIAAVRCGHPSAVDGLVNGLYGPAGVCIAGTIEVTISGRREILRPGDAYHFPSSLPHRWRNVGKGRAELISACTPPSF